MKPLARTLVLLLVLAAGIWIGVATRSTTHWEAVIATNRTRLQCTLFHSDIRGLRLGLDRTGRRQDTIEAAIGILRPVTPTPYRVAAEPATSSPAGGT